MQPALHDLVVAVAAPTVALSAASGDIDATGPGRGAEGLFHNDRRLVSRALLTLDGSAPTPVRGGPDGGPAARFTLLPRHLTDRGPDPTVAVERVRTVTAGAMAEDLVVVSYAAVPLRTQVTVEVAGDGAPVEAVKQGLPGPLATAPVVGADGAVLPHEGGAVRVTADGAAVRTADRSVVLVWDVEVPARGRAAVRWTATALPGPAPATGVVVVPPAGPPPWNVPRVTADDPRPAALLARCTADLDGLRLGTADAPDDQVLAAGAPWYLTVFGRDSLWAARMLLPLGTDLARGTLRTLARHQGRRHDVATAEEPGRILHEVRRTTFDVGGGTRLPPVYYGTVDATPLWVCLLHDAWRWGLPDDEVERLAPALEAALGWLAASAARDPAGFLRYVDRSGHGLANQGWKDSGDSVRGPDGTVADGPVALCEVQGYAVEAARAGATLLALLGRPDADRWSGWADDLERRFRAAFWVEDTGGPFPALALDGADRAVATMTSNAGHLLGTGILDPAEERVVAARLTAPDMADGYGLRTMSRTAGGYAPLSYHCGSVWPHDTAVAVAGLVRSSLAAQARPFVAALLDASAAFDHRPPELWSGEPADVRDAGRGPAPYPAACRPQAWSSAAAVVALTAMLGLTVDVPAGTVQVAPPPDPVAGALSVRGLPVAGGGLDLDVSRAGTVTHAALTGPLALRVAGPGTTDAIHRR